MSTKTLVGLGLISYSAYLWHQPLFVFTRYSSLAEPSAHVTLALSVSTFPLAYPSWRFVENPFRDIDHFSQCCEDVISKEPSFIAFVNDL